MEQLGSHWMGFREILSLSTFRKSAKKIQFFIKIWQNITATEHKDQHTVFFNRSSLSSF
jgi:hypothetical protein